jgi:hypothetical protein
MSYLIRRPVNLAPSILFSLSIFDEHLYNRFSVGTTRTCSNLCYILTHNLSSHILDIFDVETDTKVDRLSKSVPSMIAAANAAGVLR